MDAKVWVWRLAAFAQASLVTAAFAATVDRPTLELVCGVVLDEESLPHSVVSSFLVAGNEQQPSSEDPEACVAALRCVLDARQAGEQSVAAGSLSDADVRPPEPRTMCSAVAEVSGLTRKDVEALRALAVASPSDRQGEDPPQRGPVHNVPPVCFRFLECLENSLPAAAGTAPESQGGAVDSEASDASASGSWRQEFERICAQTEIATTLPAAEIRQLIADSDALLERITALGVPEAKVYVFRLRSCRNFFDYALQLTEDDSAAAGDTATHGISRSAAEG